MTEKKRGSSHKKLCRCRKESIALKKKKHKLCPIVFLATQTPKNEKSKKRKRAEEEKKDFSQIVSYGIEGAVLGGPVTEKRRSCRDIFLPSWEAFQMTKLCPIAGEENCDMLQASRRGALNWVGLLTRSRLWYGTRIMSCQVSKEGDAPHTAASVRRCEQKVERSLGSHGRVESFNCRVIFPPIPGFYSYSIEYNMVTTREKKEGAAGGGEGGGGGGEGGRRRGRRKGESGRGRGLEEGGLRCRRSE